MTEKIKGKKLISNIIFYDTKEIPYKINAFLGKRAFKMCFQITNTNNENVYAGKFVSKEVLNEYQMKEKLVLEISMHKTLKHENTVGFHEFFDDESYIYIVLELCQ